MEKAKEANKGVSEKKEEAEKGASVVKMMNDEAVKDSHKILNKLEENK